MISVFTYRFVLVVCLVALFVVFSAADNGYCTTIAAISVGKEEAHNCFEYWLNRYQSLLGVSATLIGAYFAYRAVKSQIDQNERHASDRIVRDAEAARAVLPLSLDVICDYALECMKKLDLAATDDVDTPPWPRYDLPIVPTSVISPLQDAVRHSERVRANEISELIAFLQIQSSRTRDNFQRIENAVVADYRNLLIQNNIYDAAVLYTRASNLFEFARGKYGRSGVEPGELRSALIFAGVMVEDYPVLENRIKLLEDLSELSQPAS